MAQAESQREDHHRQRWLSLFGTLLLVATIAGVVAVIYTMDEPHSRAAAELAAAEALWNAARPSHYVIEVRTISLHGGQTANLEVRDELLITGWKSDGVTPLSANELRELSAFFPMQRLFALAYQEITRQRTWQESLARAFPPLEQWLLRCPLRAIPKPTYDAARGFPRRLFVGLSPCQLQRDGTELRVVSLQILP